MVVRLQQDLPHSRSEYERKLMERACSVVTGEQAPVALWCELTEPAGENSQRFHGATSFLRLKGIGLIALLTGKDIGELTIGFTDFLYPSSGRWLFILLF